MRKTLFLFAFLGFWTQTSAQQHDKLVVGNDTTNCQLKISQRKGQIIVSFQKANQAAWNEISADSADVAIVSDRSNFVSLRLPDVPQKVWAKCFFDGTYKLLQYRGKFYIAEPGKITRLWNNLRKSDIVRPRIKIFIGQMTLIFKDKFDYKFRSLRYELNSLVKPLIQYQKANHLPYTKYHNIASYWTIGGGFSQETYKLSTQIITSVDMPGYSPFVAANLNFCFPYQSTQLFYSVGVEVSNPRIDLLKIRSINGNTVYFDLSYRGLNLAVPARIGYKLIQNPKMAVSIQTGLKVLKGFTLEQNMRVETEKDNIVRTELKTIESFSELKLLHCSEVIVGIPKLSKSISMGASYDYYLSNKIQEINTVRLGHSFSTFVRFTF